MIVKNFTAVKKYKINEPVNWKSYQSPWKEPYNDMKFHNLYHANLEVWIEEYLILVLLLANDVADAMLKTNWSLNSFHS